MKVKASTNVKYDGNWYTADEVFDIREADLAEMEGLAEPVGKKTAPRPAEPETKEETAGAEEKPKQRGSRKR